MKKEGTSKKWGGSRKGSGRKPETLSGQQVRKMITAAKKAAKKTGATIDDILLQIIYAKTFQEEKIKISERLAAIKIFKDFTMSKSSESKVTIEEKIKPQIFLPETTVKPKEMEQEEMRVH